MNQIEIKKLISLAKGDDAKAQYDLGKFYEAIGDAQNAVQWYSKSVKNRYPYAFISLADMYVHGWGVQKNDPKAFELISYAANKLCNNAVSEVLGYYYICGIGCAPDINMGIKTYIKAADLGNGNAAEKLGCTFLRGDYNIPVDYAKAVEWFERAYGMGSENAAVYLYHIYDGVYTPSMKNKNEFTKWRAICNSYNPSLLKRS